MSASVETAHTPYYVPQRSHWPIVGSVALFLTAIGGAGLMNDSAHSSSVLLVGLGLLFIMMFGWFRDVIHESVSGKYGPREDMSFRWGMGWFIFSEVMFFAAFFGALFYARNMSIPWLGGAGSTGSLTHQYLWPTFDAVWPLLHPPGEAHGVSKEAFDIPTTTVGAWGIPAINTAILLTSGWTITMAHHALKHNARKPLVLWLLATVLLGAVFMVLQVYEYGHAMHELNLTLSSGIYGSTFYMLTGFHGFHVTMGAIMILIIMLRAMSGHFSPNNHFAFEAVAWYWHFVDVVWLGLFIFVYMI